MRLYLNQDFLTCVHSLSAAFHCLEERFPNRVGFECHTLQDIGTIAIKIDSDNCCFLVDRPTKLVKKQFEIEKIEDYKKLLE